jgi:uncharacterized protein (TIGR02996 family)
MELREQFLAAVEAAPKDRDLYFVFADWLEEAGDSSGADSIRRWVDLCGERLRFRCGWSILYGVVEALYGWPGDTVSRAELPDPPESVAQVLDWVRAHHDTLERTAGQIRREEILLERAAAGDAAALLQHPVSRVAVLRLAKGERRPRHSLERPPSEYSTRKGLAAAKALLVARERRRADRAVADAARQGQPNRFRDRYLERLHDLAVELGERYHRDVRSLYQSRYAGVAYGRGGQEEADRDRYSKTWHDRYGPARCRLAGARLDSEERPTCVILESWRGTEVARLPLGGG